nr:MAG TPA: hypothetical protein [Caudoviricetes sp.]
MSLLSRLLDEVPKNRAVVRVDRQYELTRKLVPEIEEARAHGYSWSQVTRAARDALKEAGEWREEWRQFDIEKNYKQIKKEAATACM